jgi:hypothetical protein
VSTTLQQLIDNAALIDIPEYEQWSRERTQIDLRRDAAEKSMEASCAALARAVRRRFGTKQKYAKGDPSIRYDVSAHPLVNHATRPMTWTPRLTMTAVVVLWDAPRRDITMKVEVYPMTVAGVEDGVRRLKAMVEIARSAT